MYILPIFPVTIVDENHNQGTKLQIMMVLKVEHVIFDWLMARKQLRMTDSLDLCLPHFLLLCIYASIYLSSCQPLCRLKNSVLLYMQLIETECCIKLTSFLIFPAVTVHLFVTLPCCRYTLSCSHTTAQSLYILQTLQVNTWRAVELIIFTVSGSVSVKLLQQGIDVCDNKMC